MQFNWQFLLLEPLLESKHAKAVSLVNENGFRAAVVALHDVTSAERRHQLITGGRWEWVVVYSRVATASQNNSNKHNNNKELGSG